MVNSGVWDLSRSHLSPYKTRGLNLWRELNHLNDTKQIKALAYEKVLAHPRPAGGTPRLGRKLPVSATNIYAAHVYGGIMEVLRMWAETTGVEMAGVNVATLKKYATGKGNATKKMMVNAAQTKWPDQKIIDDNQADALWILDWAVNVWAKRSD
jgi:hypothetical protein